MKRKLSNREAVEVVMRNMLKIKRQLPTNAELNDHEWRMDDKTARLLLSDTVVESLRAGVPIPRGLANLYGIKIVIDDGADGVHLVHIHTRNVAIFACRPDNNYGIE